MVVPERWQEVIGLLLAPIAWVPRMQEALLAFFMDPATAWLTAAKYVFLLFPALLALGATWVTLLSLYTLPFRAGRVRFVSMMLLAWWDAARSVWLYWVGVVRVAAVIVGWLVGLGALGVRLTVESLPRVHRCRVAVDRAGRRHPRGLLGHHGHGLGRLAGRAGHDVVPVRAVRDGAAARFHLAPPAGACGGDRAGAGAVDGAGGMVAP